MMIFLHLHIQHLLKGSKITTIINKVNIRGIVIIV
jgi:hypothetical protein